MRDNEVRLEVVGDGPDRHLFECPVDRQSWQEAWLAYADEDYERSLELARRCVDTGQTDVGRSLSLVSSRSLPQIKDAILLCARNLFYLENYDEFEILLAAAGRHNLVPEEMPELDVLRLAFAHKRGECREVVEAATAFIERHRQELPPVIAEYLFLRGQAWSALGEPQQAADDAESAYAVFGLLGRDAESARAANLLGVISFRRAEFAVAINWFERAHRLHASLRMTKCMGGGRLNIGIACYKQGFLGRALRELDSAKRLLSASGSRLSLCRVGIAKGNTLRLMREFGRARAELTASYQAANESMLPREEALALEFLGDVYRDEGQVNQARRFYSRALAIGSSMAPHGDIVMEVYRRQGECLGLSGHETEAVPLLTRALGMARQQGDRFEEGVIKRVLAATLQGVGDLDSADRYSREAVTLLREVNGRYELAVALVQSAAIGVARIESGVCAGGAALLDEAWQDALAALEIFLTMAVDYWIVNARSVLAQVTSLRTEVAQRGVGIARRGRRAQQFEQPIVHVSSQIRDLIQLADAFADSDEPVLVTGETGTGKELFVRRLHRKSSRHRREMVCVNVAAIPESLFEREFFGHTRGAFSGADSDGVGFAARADGGTLFLDEIGEMSLAVQPRLLRLLQDGSYQALGDPAERHTDLRLIVATNADLRRLVAEGKFRADLYYRLKILELRLPPLRQRREDILPLLRHFLLTIAGDEVELRRYFNEESLALAQRYNWPGNVREIATVARQAHVQFGSRHGVRVEIGDPGDELVLRGPDVATVRSVGPLAGRLSDESSGRSRILLALSDAAGNRAQAARDLGVSRSTLYRHMEKLAIAPK